MQDDDYELMPRTELEYLRHEVEKLKRNPLGDTQASITLLDSINKLNASVSKLSDIFTSANDDMLKAFHDTSLQEQLHKLQENQEKLAKGIVAVSEMVKKLEETRSVPLPPIESLTPKQHIEMNAQALSADLAPDGHVPKALQVGEYKQRNPFDEPGHHAPLLNEPLPHASGVPSPPGQFGGLPPLPPRQSGLMPGQAGQAPGHMPGTGPIPEADIPPPPPRRY
jgi:hypothetical protein